MMKGLVVTGLTVAFGFVAYEKLTYVVDVVKHLTPALTTVRVNKEAIGAVAIRSLLTRFADPESTSVTSIIDVELIVRASVAPPRR